METIRKEYPLDQHPELRPILYDLRWVGRKTKEAYLDDDVSAGVYDALVAMRMVIAARFWEALYAVSSLHAGMNLALRLADDEPAMVIIREGEPDEAEESDENEDGTRVWVN